MINSDKAYKKINHLNHHPCSFLHRISRIQLKIKSMVLKKKYRIYKHLCGQTLKLRDILNQMDSMKKISVKVKSNWILQINLLETFLKILNHNHKTTWMITIFLLQFNKTLVKFHNFQIRNNNSPEYRIQVAIKIDPNLLKFYRLFNLKLQPIQHWIIKQ